MQDHQPLKLLFVLNPISGGKEKNFFETAIRNFFKDQPHTAEFFLLTGKADKISVQHHIERAKPDRVVAVGGDGTVKMIAGLLKETPIPMGIIPAGSANGMAKELGIPLVIEEALKICLEGTCKKIDIIKINEEELSIHVSDIGLNAMLVKYFEGSKSRGMWGYGKAIFRVLWEKQKMRVTIIADGREEKRHAYMVALANARKYGTGANINPDGNIADGFFEVVIVRKLNLREILKAIFTDKSFHPKHIEVISTKTLKMTVHKKAYFQVDGEYLGKVTTINARILPQILYVMTPDVEL